MAYYDSLELLSVFSRESDKGALRRGQYCGTKNVNGRDYHCCTFPGLLADKGKLLELLLPVLDKNQNGRELAGTILMNSKLAEDKRPLAKGQAYISINPMGPRSEYLRLVRFPEKSTFKTPKELLIATGDLADKDFDENHNDIFFLCTLHLSKRIGVNYCLSAEERKWRTMRQIPLERFLEISHAARLV